VPTYVSLIRGINVGGQLKIKMAELKLTYEKLGYTDIRTYIQSGNVLFEGQEGINHAARITQAIQDHFQFKVPVLVLSKKTLTRIAQENPFLQRPEIDPTHLHLTCCITAPASPPHLTSIPAAPGEEAIYQNGYIYLHLPHGYGRTKLNNNYFERLLKTPATTRNWKTIQALCL